MANTHTDEIFNVYGALDNLNKRMKIVEEKVPNYTADMLEVYRNLGALTKRIAELENLIKEVKKDGSNNNFRTANALHSFCFSSISNKNSSRPFV